MRSNAVTLAFPPFSGAVKWLVFINAGLFLLMLLLRQTVVGAWTFGVILPLVPELVLRGFIWQLASYSFVHADVWHILFNMLMLWMFGSQIEDLFRRRRFLEFYFFCVVSAAVVTVIFSYTGLFGMSPRISTVGASGGVLGVLMAFGMIYGERQLFMFPLPFMIKAKYVVAIVAFINIAGLLSQTGGIAYAAHLAGLAAGWVYVKFVPTRGLTLGFSQMIAEWQASWARRKRRRAARKFEVYMRKHNRTVYFDEHGNYIGPEPGSSDRPPDERPPWVN